MSKSICIKSNSNEVIDYLLHELECLNLSSAFFSCRKFKNFNNIIVHYIGKNISSFCYSISKILSYLVLDLYEDSIIKKIVSFEYFYFTESEKYEIINMCINNLNETDLFERIEILDSVFYEYLILNKSLNLNGFINFRLYKYIEYLNSIIDMCVNKFIIDKEYHEFIDLLKDYIASTPPLADTIHLVYKNKEAILLDKSKNIIPINKSAFNAQYLSDISFSTNDYAFNNLLTLLPKKIFLHLIDNEDDFISSLKLIFTNRIFICKNCEICNKYRNSQLNTLKY